ncbi:MULTISPECIES: DUF3042 family protein [Latilactobacillus]|jgi:hypothetical protein|uniref:DUF3042 family protein n=3 Tax=Latilactobacillus TaxID=2767885 RepID=A0A1B2A699_LATCU|nr:MULTISPECIES: DUF3042 family protein [Latilactobacillus]MDT3394391.1 DUF3042 family protein [Bacillota bacterium]ANJ69684.1 DUF3042 domain-containing protein [Latilactobacillus curvatus]ANY13475.1 DUF3042 domain-containing protein [Latilactobacillus curvatus]AOO75141.1 DUF3042 domain-containing protein [Latilactobacillus curvatus]ASN62284.1 DUF3042 domain-containing protein [Latilactobacillus curvatus]
MKHKFLKGFVIGTVSTVGAIAGSLLAFKKTVVDPIEEKENQIEESRRRANRKSHSAHQG